MNITHLSAIVGCTLANANAFQPAPTPLEPAAATVTSVREAPSVSFATRLAALTPNDPQSYILLAEEIADAANTPQDIRLAIETYALGFEAARTSSGSTPRPALLASACHALASLTNTTTDRRWLLSLVAFVDPLAKSPDWMMRPPPNNPESYAYRVALFLGYIRSGHGTLAQQMLARPDFLQAVTAMEPVLSRNGVSGGVVTLQRWASAWPCRNCGGAGISRRGNPPEFVPCSNCKGNPGPKLSTADLNAQLRLETVLLQGPIRTWSGQVNSDDGAPFEEPDPSQLCPRLRVDPTRMFYRSGRWVLRADGTDTPATEQPAKPLKDADDGKEALHQEITPPAN